MIQIVIWGIAIMLIVKGLDVLHQQALAKASGNDGAQALAIVAAIIAGLGALALVWLAHGQTSAFPGSQNVSSAPSAIDSETDNMTAVDARPSDSDLDNMAAVDAQGAR